MASTPATTAEPACCATSVATRVTRSIGVVLRDVLVRLPVARPRVVDEDDLLAAALRLDVLLPALRLVLLPDRPALAVCDRLEPALRELLEALAADRPRDFLFFVPDFPPLRDEARLLDFPRDFLALVAINGLLGVVDEIRLDNSKNQAHP
jgi:hypothetical protein